jgi:hypothetical protein
MVTMASGNTMGTVQCPECKALVAYPVRVRHLSTTKIGVSIDPTPIREHVATHEGHFTTAPPPTTR